MLQLFKTLWNKLFPPAPAEPARETTVYKYNPPERKATGSNYTPPKKKRK